MMINLKDIIYHCYLYVINGKEFISSAPMEITLPFQEVSILVYNEVAPRSGFFLKLFFR